MCCLRQVRRRSCGHRLPLREQHHSLVLTELVEGLATGSPNQFNGWSNNGYDTAIGRADALPDGSEREQLYSQAGRILASDAPVIFFYQTIDWRLVRSYIKNLAFTPIDDFRGDFYLNTIKIPEH